MPWKEQSIMDVREEFCRLALREGVPMRELCRRFGISPTTGYTWRARYQAGGRAGLADHSRRPHTTPAKTREEVEAQVLRVRVAHPCWGGRKIRAVLLRERGAAPSASTITQILTRHHCLTPDASPGGQHPIRFEAPFPNDLWQMDFKGYLVLAGGSRCHPLTVLDDHSRFSLDIRALPNEKAASVKMELTRIFERYGLPNRILCDNGGPWGSSVSRFSALGVWLLHLDVVPIHGRPYHPQTQGKEERFHRTLAAEVLQAKSFGSGEQAQQVFDAWRHVYNHERPHEALGLVVPATRYQPSCRSYPAQLPTIDYPAPDLVRRVTTRGVIKLGGASFYVGEAFSGYPLAIRSTPDDGLHTVFFRHYAVAQIDLRAPWRRDGVSSLEPVGQSGILWDLR